MIGRVRIKFESRKDGRRKREIGVRLNLRGRACSLGGVWLSLTRTPLGDDGQVARGVNVEARWWGRG